MSIKFHTLPIRPFVRTLWSWFLRPVLVCVGIPVLLLMLMFAGFQRSLIYRPARVPHLQSMHVGLTEQQVHPLQLTTSDGLTLNGWHITARLQRLADRAACDAHLRQGGPVILYLPGNGGHRGFRTERFRLLAQLGADVIAFDYRGYGDNPGSPTQAHLVNDAYSIWKYATVARGIAPEQIILFGESLGGGVATQLAARICSEGTPPAGLILQATFNSLVDTGRIHYPWLPVRLVLVDRFASVDVIPQVSCPILHLHGAQDTIVPIELGRKLFAAAPERSANGIPKEFVEFPRAGHNDILDAAGPEFRRAVSAFLSRVRGESTASTDYENVELPASPDSSGAVSRAL